MSQAKIYWDRDNYAQVEKVRENFEPLSAVIIWKTWRAGLMPHLIYLVLIMH